MKKFKEGLREYILHILRVKDMDSTVLGDFVPQKDWIRDAFYVGKCKLYVRFQYCSDEKKIFYKSTKKFPLTVSL